MLQSSDSLILPTHEYHSSSPHLQPQTQPSIRHSSTPALDLMPFPPRFRSTANFQKLQVVADTLISEIEPQDFLSAAPTFPNQQLYCSSPLATLRNTNNIRTSVEFVPNVDHQHGDDDYKGMDNGKDDYRDMEGGEIAGVEREVRGSEDSLPDEQSSDGAEQLDNQPTFHPVDYVESDVALNEFEHEDEQGSSAESSKYIAQMRHGIVDLHTQGIPNELDSDDTVLESIVDSIGSMDDVDILGSVTPPGNVSVDSNDEENDRRPFTTSI
jgi:hypothetical protein